MGLGHVFLIGPGGVGKTTVGPAVAEALQMQFYDLDDIFCEEVKNIGVLIKEKGYSSYACENALLIRRLVEKLTEPAVIALSSGSLALDDLPEASLRTRELVRATGITVMLMPGESPEVACDEVVRRQLSRPFKLKEESERRKFMKRASQYLDFADYFVNSSPPPAVVATEVALKLRGGT